MNAAPSAAHENVPVVDGAARDASRHDIARAALLWTLARRALRLALADPAGLGGVVLHGRHGPAREALLTVLEREVTLRRVPNDADGDALDGGIDTTATLAAGRRVYRPGLLDDTAGTALLLGGAERVATATAARLCLWLDRGERDTALIALDESLEDSPLPSSALGERLALHVEVPELPLAALARARDDEPPSATCTDTLVALPDALLDEIVRVAARLDVPSSRSAVQACRAARVAAALAGRDQVLPEDAALAVQLVLAPRARRLPDEEAIESEPPPSDAAPPDDDAPPPEPPSDTRDDPPSDPPDETPDEAPDDARDQDAVPERLVAAARVALPHRLLDELVAGRVARGAPAGQDANARTNDERKGRPIGTRRPRGAGHGRLNLVATLKAAIPHQRLRADISGDDVAAADRSPRLRVRREDFRVTRYRQPTRTTTVFVVDASGSAAMHRLAEAKGAVETLLAECYVRRDRVALITFRGTTATLDLPPTRSLVRARRALVGLPGGGGTPLAAGFDLAAGVLERLARDGESPVGVFMTDARANIARDGSPSREAAREDAEHGARRLARIGARLLFVDTAPRPRPDASRLAATMRARYLALPQLDTAALGGGARA